MLTLIDRIRAYLIIAAIPLFLLACKSEGPKEAAPIKKAQPAKPDVAVKAAEGTGAASFAEPDAEGARRNPFQSYIILARGTEKGKKAKGPLECCELGVFKVMAVVYGGEHSSALVQSPDKKRYIVKKGDIIGTMEGRVIKVEPWGIIVTESIKDEEGKVISTSDIELRLPSKEETGLGGGELPVR
ncbi:MAG: pilus assembly protein PilP [Deltaproteobacteria bacterium]|nr:pilus assembly protein PilP [Deltaproteobacteria bacterium]